MPEGGVLILDEHEVGWEEDQVPQKINRDNDEAFTGEFIAHPETCAQINGTRQTFSLHVSAPDDPNFLPLPRLASKAARSGKKAVLASNSCKVCHEEALAVPLNTVEVPPPANSLDPFDMPHSPPPLLPTPHWLELQPADFVNSLQITGHLTAKARGKELVIAICNRITQKNFAIRISFGLEVHCFWIPTSWYEVITSALTIARGRKSRAFAIPDEYIDGPVKAAKLLESSSDAEAAFKRLKWTLIFVDHDVMITFHLMQLPASFTAADLRPGSSIWRCLWSSTHGPVHSLEPEETMATLRAWRTHPDRLGDFTPIFITIKSTQTVFNGYGAQETTDLLLLALIHPQMPTVHLVLPSTHLPYVSGKSPFRMNLSGHRKYLKLVSAYRRSNVVLDKAALDEAHALGLFIPNAVIQPNGHASVPLNLVGEEPSIPTQLREDRRQVTLRALNYAITLPGGKNGVVTYTLFTARAGENWVTSVHIHFL
ncbi:hypothetical protein B0H10DRAFT_2218648 [Mycena sp. CBHHK59/15]|nr:hypothetical protein B0H10DRAFT_2218648 [Mycena sp. CBHHK59/15]